MYRTYTTMLKDLGDKAFYCAGFLYAANQPVAASELVALTRYKRPTVTRLLAELERRGMAVRVEQGWRIAPERRLKRR
jgi:DNA-binding IclR family transcriptional regulator